MRHKQTGSGRERSQAGKCLQNKEITLKKARGHC